MSLFLLDFDLRSSKGLHFNKDALVLKDMILYFILWFSICSKSYPLIPLLPDESLSLTMVDCFLSGHFHSRSPSSCGCVHSVSAGSLSHPIPLAILGHFPTPLWSLSAWERAMMALNLMPLVLRWAAAARQGGGGQSWRRACPAPPMTELQGTSPPQNPK